MRLSHRLKESFLPVEIHKGLRIALAFRLIKGFLNRVVRRLNQLRIGESLRPRKFKDSKVIRGLHNKQDFNSVGFRLDLGLHPVEVS